MSIQAMFAETASVQINFHEKLSIEFVNENYELYNVLSVNYTDIEEQIDEFLRGNCTGIMNVTSSCSDNFMHILFENNLVGIYSKKALLDIPSDGNRDILQVFTENSRVICHHIANGKGFLAMIVANQTKGSHKVV